MNEKELSDPAYNITPVDGRYAEEVAELRPIVSEFGLMRNRILVEAKHLICLSEHSGTNVVRKLSDGEKQLLSKLYENFSVEDYRRIKQIEDDIKHDVKSVELFFREKLKGQSIEDIASRVHIFLTSEDVTNIAYSLMLKGALFEVYLPKLVGLEEKIVELAETYSSYKMLGRTHGQPAVTTGVGKELVVYANRLQKLMKSLAETKFTGKVSGAVGSYNSFEVAYPEVDWISYANEFVRSLGLETNPITTQILPHDETSEFLRNIVSVNQIIRDLDENMWRYISDDWFLQKPKGKEVGSSTMPQKINPIDFENSEGNTKISTALSTVLADELQRSRLQRDLSGSTLQRWYGAAIATSFQALSRTTKALGSITLNEDKVRTELENHPEILMEAIQTIGRTGGISDIYDRVKEFSRGKKLTLDEIRTFVSQLPLSEEKKGRLLKLTPSGYAGLVSELTDLGIEESKKTIAEVKQKINQYSMNL